MKLKAYLKETPHIRYSNCHEDSDFALGHVKGRPQKILTIASGLDISLAFLLLSPEKVVAVDSNPAQIYLCRLKKCGIEQLEYEEFLSLLGMGRENGSEVYGRIREQLDEVKNVLGKKRAFIVTDSFLYLNGYGAVPAFPDL